MTDTIATKIEFEKATIYTTSEFMGNIIKTEVRKGEVEIKPYAQYSKAVHVLYVPKGKRKKRGFVKSHEPFVLILEGHGHPDADSLYDEAEATQDGKVSVSRGRYRCFHPGWVSDFRALISAHINDSRDDTKVIFMIDEKESS